MENVGSSRADHRLDERSQPVDRFELQTHYSVSSFISLLNGHHLSHTIHVESHFRKRGFFFLFVLVQLNCAGTAKLRLSVSAWDVVPTLSLGV